MFSSALKHSREFGQLFFQFLFLIYSICLQDSHSADPKDYTTHFREIDAKSSKSVLTYEELKTIITNKKNEISSVDNLMAFLAKNYPIYLSRVTVMRKSQGLQGDDRAIFWGKDAKFIMTIGKEENTVEIMQFRDQEDKKEFELHKVTFPKNEKEMPIFSEKNPRECLGCHQIPPRPNWASVNRWPGAYGELGDRVIKTRSQKKAEEELMRKDQEFRITKEQEDKRLNEEREALEDFLKKSKNHHRYKHLSPVFSRNYHYEDPDIPDRPVTDFDESMKLDRDATERSRFASRPNYDFTSKLSQLNYQRIAREIKDSPHYEQFKYAIVAALLSTEYPSCGVITDYLPKKIVNAIPHSLEQITKRMESDPAKPDRKEVRGVANLKYLFETRGVKDDVLNWTMNSYKGGCIIRSRFFSLLRIPGVKDAPPNNVHGLIAVLKEKDPNLDFVPEDIPRGSGSLKIAEELCKELKKKSLLAFKDEGIIADINASCSQPSEIEPIAKLLKELDSVLTVDSFKKNYYFPKVCIDCHSRSGEGPGIPFGNPIEFVRRMKSNPSLLEEIRNRIERADELKMPPKGDKSYEKSNPQDYIKIKNTLDMLNRNFIIKNKKLD